MAPSNNLMEKIVSLCKRRGFIYPSAEIYGGTGSVWDFGPLGVLLKNNVKAEWWRTMVQERHDIVGLDSAILTKREVLQASGHEKGFTDPLVECKKCHNRYRADHIDQEVKCEKGGQHEFTEAKAFNLMFKTFVGPVDDEKNLAYLRPETAQGIFVNFKNILETGRVKVPFGIAQIGKSFRNEITPGNFIFRTREFEQMEMEYFAPPTEAVKYYDKWVAARQKWYLDLGIKEANLRLREHEVNELAHYASAATDVEYKFPFGWSELEGIANRQDYDLRQHSEKSGRDLQYFDESTGKKFFPHVIEPAAGVDRATLAFLVDAFEEKSEIRNSKSLSAGEAGQINSNEQNSNDRSEGEIVLHLHPRLAPIKAAVLPLVKKGGLAEKATELYHDLQKHFMVVYDESGSVGRRYRRQDEIGTPWCITIDFETIEKGTVTIRDRDSMKQERIATNKVKDYLQEKLDN
jgi:glycyl-tRNA synthetase